MRKEQEEETGETTKDKVERMIEAGNRRNEVCAQLGISAVDYWEIEKDWLERKKRESVEMQEFYKLRVRVHERCKLLLIWLTEEVKPYCEQGTVEEIERILEVLPSIDDKVELQKYMGVLIEKEKDVENAALKAGATRRETEFKTFCTGLKTAEARKLRELDKYAAQHNLSLDEKAKKARRIRELYVLTLKK